MNRRAAAILVVLALLALAVARQLRGPEPKPASAPAGEFSAARALAAERATIGGTKPHPIGSDENHAIRDRLLAHLRGLGYDVHVEQSFACSAHPLCANVQNIVARQPGEASAPPVVFATHYDSVPAGPGASDDGSGVAALLEVARIIRNEHFRNPVVLLIDDGEEAGLLGAEAYVVQHHDTAAVVNVEARGTNGPSFLFETGANNRWFLPQITRAQAMPVTTSLFATIYDLLPNDTDLTIFKRAGVRGVNFGAIGNVAAYHTPNDDIAHVDLRTLQHQGDNALAALRFFANADLHQRAGGNVVWFDVLGLFVIWWPAKWTLWIAIVSTLVAIAGARRKSSAREVAIGVLLFLAMLVIAAVGGFLATFGEPLRAAHPAPLILGAACFGVAASLLRRSLAGTAIAWNLIGIALAIAVPGASYLFIVPGLALSIALLTTDVLPSIVAAVLWLPIMFVIYEALGKPALVVVAVAAALIASTIPIARASRGLVASLIVAGAALIAIAALLPKYSDEKPERRNVELVNAAGVPRVQVTRDGPAIHVRSQRSAGRITLDIHRTIGSLRVNGVVPPPPPARFHNRVKPGWTRIVVNAPSMDVDIGTNEPVELMATDVTYGVPPSAAPLVRARNAAHAIASQDGDAVITTTRIMK
jgi:hypothetical protein